MDQERPKLEQVYALLARAVQILQAEKTSRPSRENSETLTLVETAMMWNNKDRAEKGELPKYETHVSTKA